MELTGFLRYGFLGREAFRWVNGDDADWRRLAFLIGTVILILVMIIIWGNHKVTTLTLLLAYTVIFGYKMSIAVLIVMAGLLVFGLFSSLGGSNKGPTEQSKEDESFNWIDVERRVLDELDSTARRRLSVSEYQRFRANLQSCRTQGQMDNMKNYWESILDARWDGYGQS